MRSHFFDCDFDFEVVVPDQGAEVLNTQRPRRGKDAQAEQVTDGWTTQESRQEFVRCLNDEVRHPGRVDHAAGITIAEQYGSRCRK